jgi:hypothetical protein
MSFQTPIFESGLFGKANRFVCNSWQQSAELVAENAEGIDWAQRQLHGASVPKSWLARVRTATLFAPNRWFYTFESVIITPAHGVLPTGGNWGKGSGAINIREITNTATVIDGSPKPTDATIGPVGSTWSGTAWSLALTGTVEMHLSYDSSGAAAWWFSEPNPARCAPPP